MKLGGINIKNNLQYIRKESRISQKKFADNIGISRPYLSRIENGKVNPSLEIAHKISLETGKTINEIFFDFTVNHSKL
ncbi:TPA: helix-turn-helix transcriptional regulator [Clostridioides difficile]